MTGGPRAGKRFYGKGDSTGTVFYGNRILPEAFQADKASYLWMVFKDYYLGTDCHSCMSEKQRRLCGLLHVGHQGVTKVQYSLHTT